MELGYDAPQAIKANLIQAEEVPSAKQRVNAFLKWLQETGEPTRRLVALRAQWQRRELPVARALAVI
jgi:hypothetical protein